MAPRSLRSRKAATPASTAPAAARISVQATVSRRIACRAVARPRSASPAISITPERNEPFMSAAPLEVAGAEGQCDRGDDGEEQHALGAHEPLDEVGVVQREGEVPEQAPQRR